MASIFKIDGRHVPVTPALEEYVHKKLHKISTILTNQVTTIHVVLSVEKADENMSQQAQAEIKIAGDKNTIFAEARSDDLYASIDELERKLLAQVHKYKDKLKNHHDKK